MKTQTIILAIILLFTPIQSQLNSYNLDFQSSSTSGISAGGYMAVQTHIAFSEVMMGAGIVAGGPMMCAMGNVYTALGACMSTPGFIDLSLINDFVLRAHKEHKIDDIQNIKGQNVYLYSGTKDTVVEPGVMEKLDLQYSQLGANVNRVFDVPSQHAWITDDYGNKCDHKGEPFMNNCEYNQALDILTTIYGDLKPAVEQVQENLIEFSQKSYISYGDSLNDKGYVYVPTDCQNRELCKVHVAYHGCKMTLKDIGTKFVENSGLNEIAEANNIIVLYPQAKKSTFNPTNPNGCFDWWGYTDNPLLVGDVKYATKKGKQMEAIWKMLENLNGTLSTTQQDLIE